MPPRLPALAYPTLATLTLQAWTWLYHHQDATPGYWVALFGEELLAVGPTLPTVAKVLDRTPLPGQAMLYQIPERAVEEEYA